MAVKAHDLHASIDWLMAAQNCHRIATGLFKTDRD